MASAGGGRGRLAIPRKGCHRVPSARAATGPDLSGAGPLPRLPRAADGPLRLLDLLRPAVRPLWSADRLRFYRGLLAVWVQAPAADAGERPPVNLATPLTCDPRSLVW